MDGRNYGSGFSSWGGSGAGNRGSNNFDMYGGGGGSMSGLGGYGGGGGQMKRGLSGGSLLSPTGADNVIAKINQRLDILTQLEGGMKSSGGRNDRFEQYESYDSQPSPLTSSRDLYRSGGSSNYGYSDGRGDSMLMGQRGSSGFGGGFGFGGGGGFGASSYGVGKMRQDMRDSFSGGLGGGSGGGGWGGAGRCSPRGFGNVGGQGGGFGGRRSDLTPLGGGGRGGGGGGLSHHGHSPGGGRGKLPSLLSNRMYPEAGGFHQGAPQGPRNFPGRHFGGGPQASHQRGRKRGKPQREIMKNAANAMKKRKPTTPAADEPESKLNKTETVGTEATQELMEKNGDTKEANTPDESNNAPAAEGETAPSGQEENSKSKKKPQGKWTPTHGQERNPKLRRTRLLRRGYMERAMYACVLCKFRSFYKEELMTHLESSFHQAHLKFLIHRVNKSTSNFLQEYILDKCKKTEQRTLQLANHSASICQFYKDQDLTREIGMEHFMKKVEAAHCAACDVFIPMQHHLIQEHMRSPDHNYNRKGMMGQSKKDCLSVARSILNQKVIGQKLERFRKGENPFADNQDDQDPEDSMNMDVSELELTNDNQVEAQAEAEPTEAKVEPAKDEAAHEEMIEAETEGEIVPETVEGDRTEGEVVPETFEGDRTEGEVVPEAVEDDGKDEEIVPEADVGDGTEAEKLEEDLGVEGVEEEEDQREHEEADEEGFEIGDEEGCEDEEGVEHYLEDEEEDEGIVETEVDDELKNDDDDDDGVVVLD